MEESHTVHPLHAFDITGEPIHPGNYERELEGANCWVEFKLHHRRTAEEKHIFKGIIDSLHVLERPTKRNVRVAGPRY